MLQKVHNNKNRFSAQVISYKSAELLIIIFLIYYLVQTSKPVILSLMRLKIKHCILVLEVTLLLDRKKHTIVLFKTLTFKSYNRVSMETNGCLADSIETSVHV